MATEAQPLSDEERAELEALRAEKAAREQRARDARERAELEALRAEQAQVEQRRARSTAPASTAAAAAQAEEDRRIAEARARGAKLMEPDDDLSMPLGQKIVLAVIALLVIIVLVMSKLVR